MAYTKKTTTKKTTTTRKASTAKKPVEIEEVIDELEVDDTASLEPEMVKTPAKKKHDATDGILCRSVTVGGLFMEGLNTKMLYSWLNYGDEIEVEYRDLVSAVRSHSVFLFAPYFMVDDEDFVEEFPELDKFYREKFTVKELTDILSMNEGEMEDAINLLPKGAKEQLINIISTQVADGTLDSVRKIKALERIFDVDFGLVAQFQ